jgi:hypothetical protein
MSLRARLALALFQPRDRAARARLADDARRLGYGRIAAEIDLAP